jgi:hypothetical protein
MADQIGAQPPWLGDGYPLPLRQTAEALGFLVMLWGRLEELINVGVLRLLRVRRVRYELVGHIDFREKIQIVKSVAFTLAPGTAWFDDIEKHLNFIDNELRPERNRMIHDLWWMQHKTHTSMVRFGSSPKLKRPQSRQKVLAHDMLPITAEEVWAFVARVVQAMDDFVDLIKKTPKRASRHRS